MYINVSVQMNLLLCRDIMVSDALPAVSNAHGQLLGDEGQQEENNLRGMPIQRTSSCSSFGSEGAPYAAANGGGLNGYHHHHNYQGLIPYCFSRSKSLNSINGGL